MTMRSALAVVCVAIAATWTGALTEGADAQGTASSNPCLRADALFTAGETARARAEYVRVLVRDPSAKCAERRLSTINAQPQSKPQPSCTAAEREFDLGRLPEAQAAFEKLPPDAKCRTDGLAAIRQVKQLCAQGQAQRAAHRTDDALETFKSALAKSPGVPCAVRGISETGSEAASRLESGAITLVQGVALVIGILAAVLFVCLMLGYSKRARRFLFIIPFVGRILGPRLSMAPFDDAAVPDLKLAAPMAARVKERLQRLRDEVGAVDAVGYDLDFGNTGERFATVVSDNSSVKNALAKAKDISSQGAIVAAVLDILYAALPIRRFDVAAVLAPPDKRGVAATFSLEDNGRTAAAVNLIGPPVAAGPFASDYLDLVDPAAVWLQYEVARALSDDRRSRPTATLHAPESFALLRKGLDLYLVGDDKEARKAYEKAVELDPQNWAAHVNLAMLEARLANNYALAITILRDALSDLKRQSFA